MARLFPSCVLGGEEVSVPDAISAIILALKTAADRFVSEPFVSAVVAVPADFSAGPARVRISRSGK